MESQLIILASVLIGFLMGRFKGNTEDIGTGVKEKAEGVFEGIRKVKYEKKMEKLQKEEETSPWA